MIDSSSEQKITPVILPDVGPISNDPVGSTTTIIKDGATPPLVPPVILPPISPGNPPDNPPTPPGPPTRRTETPTDPPPETPPVAPAKGGTISASICCIGFNPEDSTLHAIFTLNDSNPFPGFCTTGMVAHVGFWVLFNGKPGNVFVGDTSVRVYGSLGNPTTTMKTMNYAVELRLTPNFAALITNCSGTLIPDIYALLTFTSADTITQKADPDNTFVYNFHAITAANFKGAGLTTFWEKTASIQFPKSAAPGYWEYLDRIGWKGDAAINVNTQRDPSTSPIHTILLKNNKILMFMGTREGSNSDIACLYDPQARTFQRVTDPVTHFLTWGNPRLPLLTKPTAAMVTLDNKEDVIRYSGNGLIYDANQKDMVRRLRIQIPRIRIPDNPGSTTTKEMFSHNANGFDFGDLTPSAFEISDQAFDSWVHDIFCSCHNMLADGRVFVIGGQERTQLDTDAVGFEGLHQHHDRGIRQVSIFNPDYNSWHTLAPALRAGRWYPGSVMLGDGRIFVMDGHPSTTDEDFHSNLDLEIFDPRNESWVREKNNNASYAVESNGPGSNELLGFFPRLTLLPDGSIFCMNRIELVAPGAKFGSDNATKDYKDVEGSYARWLPDRKIWYPVVSGQDTSKSPVMRQRYTGTLLPIFYDLNSNPDGAPGYVKENIGVVAYSRTFDDEAKGGTPNKVFAIKPLNQNPAWTWINQTQINSFKGRWNGNCVLLADGTALFIGGHNGAGDDDKNHDYNLDADILDVSSGQPKWSKGAPALKRRQYHSVALLQTDGTVLLTGTEWDKSYEIYHPDYLLRGPRPIISVTPPAVGYDQFLHIKLGSGWQFGQLRADRCGLVRLGSVTHGWGFDQRYINLYACHATKDPDKPGFRIPAPDSTDNEFRLQIPQNSNLIPPGYYTLYIFSKLADGGVGAPSMGQIVKIGG